MVKNIMLIGLGPHSKRIYYPLIKKFSKSKNIKLCMVVDIEDKSDDIDRYLKKNKVSNFELYLIPKNQMTYDKLHIEVENKLTDFVNHNNIDGVIIATEPLTHVMYAKWALKNNLSILMDKPISTYKNVSTDLNLSKKIIDDYNVLKKMYKDAIKRNSNITFSLMSQRRFHPAFLKVKELIKECYEQTNCPVTSVQTFHCDGQWRMPTEIVEQLYHPYMQGYGKCSHSGYHFFDIVPYILEAGLNNNGKKYDNVDIFTNFVKPLDVMEQVTLEDYEKLFGKDEFCKCNKFNQKQLNILMKNFGEVDAFNSIQFKKGNRVMTNVSINLAHNGFARRDWITAKGRDLYKGNGRVRHEHHIIEQGPFQCIHYHSYQSKEVNPNLKDELYNVGGEYHLEIFVFRNSGMIKGKTFEKFNIKDFNVNIMEGKSRGHQEDARARGFLEFVDSLNCKLDRVDMLSDFMTHEVGNIIASGIYQSAVARCMNDNPVVNIKIKMNGDTT